MGSTTKDLDILEKLANFYMNVVDTYGTWNMSCDMDRPAEVTTVQIMTMSDLHTIQRVVSYI